MFEARLYQPTRSTGGFSGRSLSGCAAETNRTGRISQRSTFPILFADKQAWHVRRRAELYPQLARFFIPDRRRHRSASDGTIDPADSALTFATALSSHFLRDSQSGQVS